MRTTPAPSEDSAAPNPGTEGVSADERGQSGLYELWQPEELRRHVAILESELARMTQDRAELEDLRRWKTQVERSRAWRVASSLGRLRRLSSRVGRAVSRS